MAKLDVMPQMDIISGFKGTIDFYVHRGIPCARKWPRPPRGLRAPAVQDQWPNFIIASREWTELSPVVQDAYRALAVGSGLTGRDLQVRSYLIGLYRYPLP